MAADPDPPIAFASAPQDDVPQAAPLPGTHGGGRTEESTLRRRGIDPETGLRVQSCSCKTQQECRRIMQKYASMGNSDMCLYLRLPGYPKATETPSAQHIIQFRDNVCHHLYGYGESTDLKKGKSVVDYVALHHFHPLMRPYLRHEQGVQKLSKWRVPLAIGRQCGLTDRDLCKVMDSNGEKSYLCSPIRRWKDIQQEFDEAEHKYNAQLAALDDSLTTVASVAKSGRKSPREKEYEMEIDALLQEAQANPRALAIRLHQEIEKNESLQNTIDERKKQTDERESKLRQELEEARDKVTKELIDQGLNRKILLSNEYHNTKKWVSPHLFGLPWEEHKARGAAMFGETVDNFNVNVTGDEKHITEFEQHCICCMVCWRGFFQKTIAAIYNRDRSSISRYMKKWMPLLGAAGANMSELDLVMNHNLYDVDYCKEKGLLYMENGIAMLNGQPINIDEY